MFRVDDVRSLLLRNLALTIPTALLFTGLGYLLSMPMLSRFDPQAALFRRDPATVGSIETARLIALDRFQVMVALGGTVTGIVVAQTVFVASEQRSTRKEREAE